MTKRTPNENDRWNDAVNAMPSVVIEGSVFMDVDVITAINRGVMEAFDQEFKGKKDLVSPDFVYGVSMALELYRKVHESIMCRHASELIPDFAPDK